MDTHAESWKVDLSDEQSVETTGPATGWTVKLTVKTGGNPSSGYMMFSQFPSHEVNEVSYFFRVAALLLILCLFGCYYYFAYVRKRPVPVKKAAEPAEEDDRAKVSEAKMNAALAARWRQETFDKSGAEEEARKIVAERAARKAAEFAKKWPRHRGSGDSPLKWQVGTASRRGFT